MVNGQLHFKSYFEGWYFYLKKTHPLDFLLWMIYYLAKTGLVPLRHSISDKFQHPWQVHQQQRLNHLQLNYQQ